jgi:hypothetical protein
MIAAATALTGAAVGGLGTYMSTREANAHDSERLHAEEVQADGAELRRVLDDGAGSLYVAQRNFARGLLVRAQTPAAARALGGLDGALGPLNEQVDRITRDYNRVAIRLGRRAPAAVAMKRALDTAGYLDLQLRALSYDRSSAAQAAKGFEAYKAQSERFLDAANRVAGSTTR